MRLQRPLRALVINLDRDTDRMARVTAMMAEYPSIQLERVPGVLGSELPLTVRDAIVHKRNPDPGTLGCFLAHVKAWERVRDSGSWALVLEDDCVVRNLDRLFDIEFDPSAEYVYVNGRGDPRVEDRDSEQTQVLPTTHLLSSLSETDKESKRAPGGDGYLLSPEGARKMLEAVAVEGFGSHVDWRMLRYGIAEDEARKIMRGKPIAAQSVLKENRAKPRLWGVMKAYCLSPSLVSSGGFGSSRTRVASTEAAELAQVAEDRPITLHDAKLVRKLGSRRVGIEDFELGAGVPVTELPPGQALPYAVDMRQRLMQFTLHDDARKLCEAPFVYAAQRDTARRLAQVPFARLDAAFGAWRKAARPVLVLSIGRTGSTLLDALLRVAMPLSVSEPDTMTQLAGTSRLGHLNDRSIEQLTLWHALSPFLQLAGDDRVAVKFRSQVNLLSPALARVFPNARYVFMLRDPESWALSTYRSFKLPPEGVVGRLLGGINAIDRLTAAGVDLNILRYEELLQDPRAAIERIAGPDPSGKRAAGISAVMSTDSQAGTHLAGRTSDRTRTEDENAWMGEFLASWQSARPSADIARLKLEL